MDRQNLSTDPEARGPDSGGPDNGGPDNGGSNASPQRPPRRSKRMKEAEKLTNPGNNDSPEPRTPTTTRKTRVVKIPKTRVPKNPSKSEGGKNRTNEAKKKLNEDSTIATQDLKDTAKQGSSIGVGISTLEAADTPDTSAASSGVASKLDNNIKSGDVQSNVPAPSRVQSDTPRGSHLAFGYKISYDQGQATDNSPATHDYQIDQEVKAKGHAKLRMSPKPAARVQSLETSGSPAQPINFTHTTPRPVASVGDYVSAKRLAPPVSQTESIVRSSPHHYVALADIQGTSDALPPNYSQLKPTYTPLLQSTYLQRSTATPETSASPSWRTRANGSEQARQADNRDTANKGGQSLSIQSSYANDVLARPLASKTRDVAQSRRGVDHTIIDGYRPKWTNTGVFDIKDYGSQDGIPLDYFASNFDPRDSKVGLTNASDDLAVILLPITDFCDCYCDQNGELFFVLHPRQLRLNLSYPCITLRANES